MSSAHVDHLCVLIHGLWGSPHHLNFLRETLPREQPKENIHILVAKSNASNFTYDGIEVGAERIAHEVEQTIALLTEQGASLTKISVIGYSLGGLIARYTIGLLYKDGVFERLKPVNFTTFASPHLGVRSPTKGFRGVFWNSVAPRTLSASGRQMFLIDKFRDTNRPLLVVMSDPNSVFVRALKMFKNKSLYANTMNDRSVPYYTAKITEVDPFVDPDDLEYNFVKDQDENVVLDPDNPVSQGKPRPVPGSLYERFQMIPTRTWNSIPFYAALTVLLPVGVTVMLINSGYQTFTSARRIQLHETGKASVDPVRYRIPLLEEAQILQDQTAESLANPGPESYLPTPPPEPTTSMQPKLEKSAQTFPKLELHPDQMEIIRNMDQVGLTKYPVHIQNVRHTHAAIVVRTKKDSFHEGEVVVRHWARKFEA